MYQEKKRSLTKLMRSLHRDIGALVVGLTIIFALSGIIFVYRDVGLLHYDKTIQRNLAPNLDESSLGAALHLRGYKVLENNADEIVFQGGRYKKSTGMAVYKNNEYPALFKKLAMLHKSVSASAIHWVTLCYAILLLFLAISSFWMYNPKTKVFKRFLFLSGVGFVFSAVLLLL